MNHEIKEKEAASNIVMSKMDELLAKFPIEVSDLKGPVKEIFEKYHKQN